MMYRIVFLDRETRPQYVISRDCAVVWATESFEVFIGRRIETLINWLEEGPRGRRGTWSVVNERCKAPKVGK